MNYPKFGKKIHDLLILAVPSNASACQRNKHFGFWLPKSIYPEKKKKKKHFTKFILEKL
jgi:hypothetical protein